MLKTNTALVYIIIFQRYSSYGNMCIYVFITDYYQVFNQKPL